MRPSILAAARAAALALAAATPALADGKPEIAVEEHTLANGMRWLLYEQHDSPTVAAFWTARVGSVNERPGITGISHFFEHMMFKGTRTIGTKDAAEDLRLIEEQEKVRDAMRAETAVMREKLRRGEIDDLDRPEGWTPRYRELDARFDALVGKQRETIVKDELDRIYTANGGEFLNAFTSEDQTAFYVQIPRNRLELWAWLESDRLLDPVFREFYSERDVVFEERRLSVESTPLGKFDEEVNALFWEAIPYRWPVVGWASDIPTYTLAQAKQYFATYYAPNNITGVLAGDFVPSQVMPLLERYFGRIPRGAADPPPVVTLEPKPLGEKRFDAEAETSPTVRIWWKTVPLVHRDTPALDLLSDVLSGRTGRLYKALVLGSRVASQSAADHESLQYGGIFKVETTVREGTAPAAAEAGVLAEVERLQDEEVPARELQKVKNAYEADAYRRLSSPFFVGMQLVSYDALGDWRLINTLPEKADAVTAADLQRVAREYLARDNRMVATFVRKPGAPAGPAARPAGKAPAAGNE